MNSFAVGGNGARSRELKAVAVMALGFGLVGIDRFLIATMFPVIARDLHLGYGDIGVITGALAIAWGASALFTGNASDRIGRRTVLVGSMILFALLIGASGLAAGLAGLVAVRIAMGVADGAYTPTSIAATIEASAPRRHGLNIGIQQMMLPLCGLGIAPLLVAALLRFIDWR
jgi:MFS family permease